MKTANEHMTSLGANIKAARSVLGNSPDACRSI